EDPQPQCILARFTDSVAEYQARYWLTNVGQDEATDSEVRQRIFLALRRAGIPLSVPAQSVFLTQESAERQHRKEKRSIAARVQALQEIELFHSLTDEELHQLAEHLASFPFAPGDIITRQGDTDHWLYIVIEGQASVELAAPGGPPRVLAELGPGDFFGEMALLLGEPRRATVVARTPLESFRLDKQVFELVVQSRPEVAGEISRVLAHRRTELEAAEEHLGAEAHAARVNTMQGQILERIRSFFSLG
ncbi:MAG: cyclic nucleotide-binding domain-containing protein, partial [Armatimonadetes bacterium]|nr:cyclic nucleotide-binding domain-containing protein [Armatimonadota bacterium]